MEELAKILPAVFKQQVRRGEPLVVEILAPLWPRVAGKHIAQQCRPVAFEAGTLTLATACLSWATQLRHMAEEIRAQINRYLGGPVVRSVRVKHVMELDPLEAPAPQQELQQPLVKSEAPIAAEDDKLDPEIARIIGQSFAKYFARQGKKTVH